MSPSQTPCSGFNTQPPEGGCGRPRGPRWTPHSFNTQPPEGGCIRGPIQSRWRRTFQHTAARRRLRTTVSWAAGRPRFQHTAARRRLLAWLSSMGRAVVVSTHSRPKAAAVAFNSYINAIRFQHTAARRRLPSAIFFLSTVSRFQHTAARRRLRPLAPLPCVAQTFQHTAARRRLPDTRAGDSWPGRFNTQPPEGGCQDMIEQKTIDVRVSTHSRPKAAAASTSSSGWASNRFNTQPPEGGCRRCRTRSKPLWGFNTQPPEGGCRKPTPPERRGTCFNTQPPEGGCMGAALRATYAAVSTHSRPKAAAKEVAMRAEINQFQHTAARRRLRAKVRARRRPRAVSTHSRPKAAARIAPRRRIRVAGFNTQPPEGGCLRPGNCSPPGDVSTHSRPKAAAASRHMDGMAVNVSTHSRPKAAAGGPA